MCNPLLVQVVAAGTQAYSAYQGAKGERGQANFAAGVADNNAVMAEAAAADAIFRGGLEANKARREGAVLAGKQRAQAAASGLDVSVGAPAQIVDETGFLAEQDATTIRNNAARQAWGFRQEAQDYRSSASMSRAVAKASSPGRAATMSLLSSATSTALSFATAPTGAMTKTFSFWK